MSEQLALDYSPRKLARRRDPDTSHAAAQGERSTNRMRLLAVFAAAWPQGLTYKRQARPGWNATKRPAGSRTSPDWIS